MVGDDIDKKNWGSVYYWWEKKIVEDSVWKAEISFEIFTNSLMNISRISKGLDELQGKFVFRNYDMETTWTSLIIITISSMFGF